MKDALWRYSIWSCWSFQCCCCWQTICTHSKELSLQNGCSHRGQHNFRLNSRIATWVSWTPLLFSHSDLGMSCLSSSGLPQLPREIQKWPCFCIQWSNTRNSVCLACNCYPAFTTMEPEVGIFGQSLAHSSGLWPKGWVVHKHPKATRKSSGRMASCHGENPSTNTHGEWISVFLGRVCSKYIEETGSCLYLVPEQLQWPKSAQIMQPMEISCWTTDDHKSNVSSSAVF